VLALPSSLGTTTELWDANVPHWSEKFRVLRYDQRGHGGSDVPPAPYSIEDLAADPHPFAVPLAHATSSIDVARCSVTRLEKASAGSTFPR